MRNKEELFESLVRGNIHHLDQFNEKNNDVEVPFNYKTLRSFCEEYYKVRLNEESSDKKEVWQPLRHDIGFGKCKEKNCQNWAEKDYNGHHHYVCQPHYDSLTSYFEEEYD